jgi:hypothetical protein
VAVPKNRRRSSSIASVTFLVFIQLSWFDALFSAALASALEARDRRQRLTPAPAERLFSAGCMGLH